MPVLGQPRATKPSWQPVKGTRDKGFKDCVLFAEVLIYSMSAARSRCRFLSLPQEPGRGAGRQNRGAGFDGRGFDDAEMRRTLAVLSTAATLTAGPLVFGSNRAEAMVTALPLGQAAQSVNPIEKRPAGGWVGAACACSHAIIMRLPLRSVRKHYAACQPFRSMG